MGTLTVTISRGTPALNGSKTYTIPDAHITRLIDWAIEVHSVNGVTPTAGQALTAWFDDFMSDTKAAILAREKRVASDSATASIAPITAT